MASEVFIVFVGDRIIERLTIGRVALSPEHLPVNTCGSNRRSQMILVEIGYLDRLVVYAF